MGVEFESRTDGPQPQRIGALPITPTNNGLVVQ